MAKCPICRTRKAKRLCPVKKQDICAICCAEKRMIELACPESCLYLRDARQAAGARRTPKLLQYLAANDKVHLFDAFDRFNAVIAMLERAIVKVQRYQFRDLTDEEVLAGVENAIKTYETLDRGIIYEHASESPRIRAVTRALLDEMERMKKTLQEQQRSDLIKTRDFLACLEFIRETIRFEREWDQDARSWLRYAALYQPYPEEETQPLIVSG